MALDDATFSTQIIGYEHHEIHDGSHYFLKNFSTLGTDAELAFEVTTASTAKWPHLLFSVNGTTQTEIRIFEGATLSGGTVVTPINNNRNSTNTSNINIRAGTVISGASPTSGTLLSAASLGLAGTTPSRADQAGATKRTDEIILKSGTTYLISLINNDSSNTNIVDYRASWYEHTDKIQKF